MKKEEMQIKKGDYIMHDGGGVAYATFGLVEEVTKEYIDIKGVFVRQRINQYSLGYDDLITWEYDRRLHISEGNRSRIYHITKEEYDTIRKVYDEFSKVRKNIEEVMSKTYFETKKK